MDSWVIAVISLIGSTGLSTLVGLLIKAKVGKKIDEQEELLGLRQREQDNKRNKEMIKIVSEGLQPVCDTLKEISVAVANNSKGTVTLLREDMKKARDRLMSQGHASASDVASWHELYNTYALLGGNHFREYVDAWKDDVDNLPREGR